MPTAAQLSRAAALCARPNGLSPFLSLSRLLRWILITASTTTRRPRLSAPLFSYSLLLLLPILPGQINCPRGGGGGGGLCSLSSHVLMSD